MRLASLFLTLPTRWLTGHITISPAYGTSIDFSSSASAGASPNHTDHVSGGKMTGIRLWTSAHSSFGVVVMMLKDRTVSLDGDLHVSQSPARAISDRSARAIA